MRTLLAVEIAVRSQSDGDLIFAVSALPAELAGVSALSAELPAELATVSALPTEFTAVSAELPAELAAVSALSAAPEREVVRPSKPRQHLEPLLLAVIEALVERGGRVGIVLERRTALCQGIGPLLRALDRIARPVPIPAAARRIHPLSPQRRELAVGLLEGRP